MSVVDNDITETELALGAPSDFEGTFVIAVRDGPDRGTRITFDSAARSRVLVGQSSACQLRLTDREVSRRHAALEVVDRGIRLTDLGSKNGTYVDRIRVFDAVLEGGEMVRLGSTVLTIAFDPDEKPVDLANVEQFGRVLGRSRAMRRLYPLCARLAATAVPLVIEGETGTGKEHLAEAIHEQGPRSGGPFVVFDCTTVPTNLLESELFGHERGAFTGAVMTRRGVFEQAAGGTLLIDEIGDLDIALQAKLLRAIERSEVRRVGGDRFVRVDVRLIAATRRNLDREVAAGRFRDDLFHRLVVARIELPPLKDRADDIPLLAEAMWRDLGGDPRAIPSEVMTQWLEHTWPGNIRELRNAVLRLHALGDLANDAVMADLVDDAPPASVPAPPAGDVIGAILTSRLSFPEARARVMAEFEKRYVEHLLAQNDGDLAAAAGASGIGRRYFQMLRARTRRRT